MKTRQAITTLLLASLLAMAGANAAESPISRKQLFDDNWLFALGDNATAWQTVNLPHDWSIAGPFDASAPAGNDGGYLPTGKGTYRKTFTLSEAQRKGVLRLYFEGVYMNAEVFVNGQKAGGHPYGYSSFFVDVTPYCQTGQNEVEVRVDNSQQRNSRWYSGSGIYRHVWLLTTPKIYLDDWGLNVRTAQKGNNWQLTVSSPLASSAASESPAGHYLFRHKLYDAEGNVIAEADGAADAQTMAVRQPRLWSPDEPNLYRLKTQLVLSGEVIDELTTPVGFRTIDYTAERGLRLNGQPITLNGGCVHHDNGILGASAFDRAEYRRVERLKASGFNAIRTSHNPPSPAFLTACDELGLLVIDEAFDGWRDKKTEHDYASLFDAWWQEDLRAMVLRDRNHPSIFCWSTGNEVIERKHIGVIKTAHDLTTLCHELDPTRPVTSALCAWDRDWEIYDPLAAEHDIVGYNYMIFKAESDHARIPERVMVQTESYPRDAYRNYRAVQDHPYVIGDFVWTAIDYLGESGIGRWYYEGDIDNEHWVHPLFPWHASYCGDIDLIGQRKAISHYRSMLWNDTERLYMAVREPDGYYGRKVRETNWGSWPTFESWSWPGWEGKPIDVEVYARYPRVRLYLDNQLIGEKDVPADRRVSFNLPYAAGTLRAEGIEDGDVKESTLLMTAGDARTIRLTADRTTLAADGQDLAFVTVELVDAKGVVHPLADNLLTATVKGPATLAAFGNADIKDTDSYADSQHHAWKGRALIVVRSTQKKGTVTLSVGAQGLRKGNVTLRFK